MSNEELFFVMLFFFCRYVGFKVYNIDGCVRNMIKYEIGSDFKEQKKSWIVVLLDGNW